MVKGCSFEVDDERIGRLHVSDVAPSNGQGWTLVPRPRGAGYDVDCHELRGGHTVPEPMVNAALDLLAGVPAELPVSSP